MNTVERICTKQHDGSSSSVQPQKLLEWNPTKLGHAEHSRAVVALTYSAQWLVYVQPVLLLPAFDAPQRLLVVPPPPSLEPSGALQNPERREAGTQPSELYQTSLETVLVGEASCQQIHL